MKTVPNRIRRLVISWIKQHDKVATHYKIWLNGNNFRFQCCIGQESYGGIFSLESTESIIKRIS